MEQFVHEDDRGGPDSTGEQAGAAQQFAWVSASMLDRWLSVSSEVWGRCRVSQAQSPVKLLAPVSNSASTLSISKRGRHTSDASCGFVSRKRGTLRQCCPRRVGRCWRSAHRRPGGGCRRGKHPCCPPLVRRARSSRSRRPWRISPKALGATEQGAQDYYHRQFAKQEEYVPEFPRSVRSSRSE